MSSPRPGPIFAVALTTLLPAFPQAARAEGQKLLTIDILYDPEKSVDFGGNPPTGVAWLDDSSYVWARADAKARTAEWFREEAQSGKTTPFFDVKRMEAALARLPGVSTEETLRLCRQRSYVTNDKQTAVLLTIGGDLYHYPLGGDRAVRLTFTAGEEEEATYSPDGTLVAFVRENNLYLVEVDNPRDRPLTTDGSPTLLNGKLDWIYQEEVYGRNRFRAYWWSPDSSRIAFLQLDEKGVPKFTLEDHIPYRLEVENWPYPKAGDPNPTVKLGIARVSGGAPSLVSLEKYAPVEFLLVDVGWTPDSQRIFFSVQDREQTWLDLNTAPPSGGESATLFRETTPAWVDNHGAPIFQRDGSFLWFSERSGFKHLYHYKSDGTLIRAVTSGRWEVRTVHGVDEGKGLVYFSGTERSPIGLDVYRARLDGTGLTRLSSAPGVHRATFSPGFSHYLDTWSDVATPPQVRLHRADGTEARVVDSNRVAALSDYRLAKPEFVQVKTRDGFPMEALLLKPPDFDPTRKYPVFQHTYAGPHAPQVQNAWGGPTYLFHQMLAQKGIVVWICDNRTASGKGAESTWPGYKRMGELELQDIEDGVAWLKQQPWVDGARIGISGWSYGGFMTSYALTHSKSFAMGIAGGSVTDWRNYDSIYTERYMRMPQNNPEGYKRTAPRAAAKDLHGALLLIHGTMDDNVHLQNTLQFAYELQKAGKPFRLMTYPKSRHAVAEPALVKHLRSLMLDFILETLTSTSTSSAAAAALRPPP